MKQFELNDWTAATVESATPRIERHGNEKVVAISLGLRINAPNLMIDLLSETLREGLYAADETQDPLPGVTRQTVLLRAPEFAGMKFDLPTLLEGAIVYFDHGIAGEDEPIALGDAKVDKVKVSPMASAWCDYFLRVGSNDVSEEELGILCGKLGHETRIRIEPPRVQPTSEKAATDAASDPRQPTLDGTTGSEISEPSPERQAAERAFTGAVDGDDDSRDAGDHVADDVERNGEGDTAQRKPRKQRAKAAA